MNPYMFIGAPTLSIYMKDLGLLMQPYGWMFDFIFLIFYQPTIPHSLPIEVSDFSNFWFLLVFLWVSELLLPPRYPKHQDLCC